MFKELKGYWEPGNPTLVKGRGAHYVFACVILCVSMSICPTGEFRPTPVGFVGRMYFYTFMMSIKMVNSVNNC